MKGVRLPIEWESQESPLKTLPRKPPEECCRPLVACHVGGRSVLLLSPAPPSRRTKVKVQGPEGGAKNVCACVCVCVYLYTDIQICIYKYAYIYRHTHRVTPSA